MVSVKLIRKLVHRLSKPLETSNQASKSISFFLLFNEFSNQYMIQSVIHMQKDDEIVMAVQCEARFDKKTNKYKGFQVSDEQILKVFCYYLQLRFERRLA